MICTMACCFNLGERSQSRDMKNEVRALTWISVAFKNDLLRLEHLPPLHSRLVIPPQGEKKILRIFNSKIHFLVTSTHYLTPIIRITQNKTSFLLMLEIVIKYVPSRVWSG